MKINAYQNPLREQSGFSMVELLIAVALGIVLSWAILDVTLNSSRTARELELTSEMVENGRYLTNLLSGELQLAGFYGRLEDYVDVTVTAQPDACGLSSTSLRNGMNYPLFGLDGVAPGDHHLQWSYVLLTGSDALLIRRADTTSVNSTAGLVNARHYLQETVTAAVLDLGTNSSSFNLLEKDGTTVAAIREYHQDIYFVDTDNVFNRLSSD